MPRLSDELRDCVIYLYASPEAAREGRDSGGSGFLVSTPGELDKHALYSYAVTNRHVLDQCCLTIRLNTERGETAVIETGYGEWHQSRVNDVAICPIKLDIGHTFKLVPQEMFITPAIIDKEGIGMGDDVFLVGRLIDHAGKQRNTPSARFGNIAMMPIEKIRNKHLDVDVESFLCELKSIGGFSGSPVFVWIPPGHQRPGSNSIVLATLGPWLLGVDLGHLKREERTREKNGNKTTDGRYVERNSGIGTVVPAWHIAQLLEELRPDRVMHDARRIQLHRCSPMVMDGGSDDLGDEKS